MSDGTRAFDHDPVMRDEIVATFRDVPAGVIVDATLGGGGHSEALLESRTDLRILGLDRDPAALDAASDTTALPATRGVWTRGVGVGVGMDE